MMNRSHPNFGLKTKISEKEWWRKLIRGKHAYYSHNLNQLYFYIQTTLKIIATSSFRLNSVFIMSRVVKSLLICSLCHYLFLGTFDAYQLSDEKINNMTNYLIDLYKTSSCWGKRWIIKIYCSHLI